MNTLYRAVVCTYYNSYFLQQFQKAEMDGKLAVSSKPAQTHRSAPVVCQLPEPCVQDDEQLQMVCRLVQSETTHSTAIYM